MNYYWFCCTWACVLVYCWLYGGAAGICYQSRPQLPLFIDWATADMAKHRKVYQDNWFDLVKR